MAEKLDFSLPQKKSRGSRIGALTVVLLVVLLTLVLVDITVNVQTSKRMLAGASGKGLPPCRVGRKGAVDSLPGHS